MKRVALPRPELASEDATRPDKRAELAKLATGLREEIPELKFAFAGRQYDTAEAGLVAWGYSPEVPAVPDAPAARLFLFEVFEGSEDTAYLLATVEPGAVSLRALDLLDGLTVMGRIGEAWARAAGTAEGPAA